MVDPAMAQYVYDDADDTTAAAGADDDEKSYDRMALQRWKDVDKRGAHFWGALEILNLKRSWLTVYPTSKALTLLDFAVQTALRLLMNIGQEDARCVNAQKTRTSPNVKSLDHSVSCNRCAGPWWKIRHNEGLAALFATAQAFNIAMQADVGALLGTALEQADELETSDAAASDDDAAEEEVKRTKKRPDGYLILSDKGNSRGGASLVMFDFTCVHINALEKYAGTNNYAGEVPEDCKVQKPAAACEDDARRRRRRACRS